MNTPYARFRQFINHSSFATIVLLSPSLSSGDGFDDAFAEMDKQIEQDYQQTAKSKKQQASEFEQWKQQQAQEYADYKKAYFEALNNYKKGILEHWDKAEVTDKKNWVDYSEDLQTKRVVDFEKNEIRISVLDPSLSNENIQKLVDANLEQILEETPNTARKKDPVLKAVKKTAPSNDKQSRSAILSELTEQKTLKQQKAALKKQAVISRPAPKTKASPTASKKVMPVVVTIKLPKDTVGRRAAKYQQLVKENAKKNQLDPSLVYAIMHTESAFNPMARSHIPAYGLMQIVPESAGRDVSMRLYGKDQIFSADYLYNAGNNVQAGATYINILYYSYLKGVKDPLSRLYCTIAAYNTGSGNVAKTFTGKRNLRKALPIINSLSPEQVYKTLHAKLPYHETREYLKRVVSRQKLYANI